MTCPQRLWPFLLGWKNWLSASLRCSGSREMSLALTIQRWLVTFAIWPQYAADDAGHAIQDGESSRGKAGASPPEMPGSNGRLTRADTRTVITSRDDGAFRSTPNSPYPRGGVPLLVRLSPTGTSRTLQEVDDIYAYPLWSDDFHATVGVFPSGKRVIWE